MPQDDWPDTCVVAVRLPRVAAIRRRIAYDVEELARARRVTDLQAAAVGEDPALAPDQYHHGRRTSSGLKGRRTFASPLRGVYGGGFSGTLQGPRAAYFRPAGDLVYTARGASAEDDPAGVPRAGGPSTIVA